MNYGETLVYWYLRFNGFFLIQNFVLHPLADSEGSDKQAADSDLLAVRFPYVYEETGGQPDDWDPRLRTWDLTLNKPESNKLKIQNILRCFSSKFNLFELY